MRVYIADAALCSDSPRSLLYELREHSEKYRRVEMAASRSSCLTFVTRLALIFVVTVNFGVTGKKVGDTSEETSDDHSSKSSSAKGPNGACPVEKGYLLYDNHCLKLYSIKQDHETATARCKADGAHLFYFKSREQDRPALLYLLETEGVVLPNDVPGLWVGADDIKVEGQFVWSDLTRLPTDTGLWSSSQPDNFLGNEDCAEVGLRNSAIGLNDFTCTAKLGYVCQIDMKKSVKDKQ